jgi:proline dehydrogenase
VSSVASEIAPAALERQILAVAKSIASAYPRRSRASLRALEDALIARSGERPEIRTALLRFVDVAPACRPGRDRGAHLAALLEDARSTPRAVVRGLDAELAQRVLGRASGPTVGAMARRFIAGRDPQRAASELRRLWRSGRAASVDLLGEATVSAAEADRYAARCADALARLSASAIGWPPRPRLEHDRFGSVPRVNLSIKVSALTAELRAADPRRGVLDALPRVRALARAAHVAGAHLHLDMESYDSHTVVIELLGELLNDRELRDGPSLGIVLQAYLRDSSAQLDQLLELVAGGDRAVPLTIRLVKGAYWDHETVDAAQHGWHPPTFTLKRETDRNFELLTRRLLDARTAVRLAVASHNLRSIAHAVAANRATGGDDRDLEIQVLRGLGDDLGQAVAREGLRARVYTPVGGLVEGMAYLVRRLLENAANESFLAARVPGDELDSLLAAP